MRWAVTAVAPRLTAVWPACWSNIGCKAGGQRVVVAACMVVGNGLWQVAVVVVVVVAVVAMMAVAVLRVVEMWPTTRSRAHRGCWVVSRRRCFSMPALMQRSCPAPVSKPLAQYFASG